MPTIPEPLTRFGIALVVAILWAAKGYILSVYRGEKEFKVLYAAKTVLLGVVAGALGFVTGGDVATAAAIAVPFVDDAWSRFSSTWNKLEDLPVVERFNEVANQLVDEYGDDAAEKMDETRRRLADDAPAPKNVFEKYNTEPPAGQTGTPADHPDAAGKTPDPNAGKPPGQLVVEKVDAVPETYKGYQKLRAVAGQIPDINGNKKSDLIRMGLKHTADSEAVLDAFATVEEHKRDGGQAEQGGESA